MHLDSLTVACARTHTMIECSSFSLLDHLLQLSSDSIASSLSEEHDLEAFEIIQVSTGTGVFHFLSAGCGIKCFLNVVFLEGFDYGLSASTSEHRNALFGKSKSLNRVLASGEIGTINKDCVHVTDVNNDNAFSVIGTIADPADSASLNIISEDLKTMT